MRRTRATAVVLVTLSALACGSASRGGEKGSARWIPRDDLAMARRPLSPAAAAAIDARGFAIIDGEPVNSFHTGYTALFHAHQPPYITADSILYAWHSSYDALLRDLELGSLIPMLDGMLAELRERLAGSVGRAASAEARADVDAYLGVALSLARGGPALPPVAGGDAAAIAALVDQGTKAAGLELELFGTRQKFDFSMLQPRGHYTATPELQRYFRAMSWLGRVEVRIANRNPQTRAWVIDRRALRGAALLGALLDGKPRATWAAIDGMLATFVGPPDSMSVPGLTAALAALPPDLDPVGDAAIAAAFEARSAQRIGTQLAHPGEEAIAFVVMGQRFVHDAKVLGEVVYGKLPLKRMMPSPLDVGYAVLGNGAAKQLLAPELERFGAVYAEALEAARRSTQADDPALWQGSLYHLWLGALGALSPDPARDAGLPAPLTGEPWARRMLGTQLASWAELRHDNLLYAKQSVTAMAACEYPDAYVEPYPAFFAAMEAIAKQGRAAIEGLGFAAKRADRALAYFDNLGKTMARLRAMAERERANQPLTAGDLDFINRMVALAGRDAVCTTAIEPEGWYADLYYDRGDILWHKPVIADVHTQPTDEAGTIVGRVLHVGTATPRMLVARLAHDRGTHAQTYRGFVSSYAEITTESFVRLTDEDWRERVRAGKVAPPAWLADLIVR